MKSKIPESILNQIKKEKELDSNEIQDKIYKLNKNCIIEDFYNDIQIAYVDGNFYKTELSFYGDYIIFSIFFFIILIWLFEEIRRRKSYDRKRKLQNFRGLVYVHVFCWNFCENSIRKKRD